MHVYIDESGLFIPTGDGNPKAQAVGALVVPSAQRTALGHAYRKLRRKLRPGGGEIKGSSLSEFEAEQLLDLCGKFDLLFLAVIVDVGVVSSETARIHRDAQADKLLSSLTRDHQPTLVHELVVLHDGLRSLAPQLYLQTFAILHLIPDVLQIASLYYVQRRPTELGTFEWFVDCKDSYTTRNETLWSTLLLPIMQTRSRSSPFVMLEGADYSYFDRFSAPLSYHDNGTASEEGTDLRQVVGRHLYFKQSHADLGVQLADNLVAIATRALNGNIAFDCASRLGQLMPMWKHQPVRIIVPGTTESTQSLRELPYARWNKIIQAWRESAKSVLVVDDGRRRSDAGIVSTDRPRDTQWVRTHDGCQC